MKKAQIDGLKLLELIEKLKKEEKRLEKDRKKLSNRLQTSFLKKNILDEQVVVDLDGVLPVLETIADIARYEDWFENLEAKRLIYDVLRDLRSFGVLGDPAKNMFRVSLSVFVLHCFAWIFYVPMMTTLMVLVMLGRIYGWIILITGILGAGVSVVAEVIDNNSIVVRTSNVLGIITNIFATAKGISLEKDEDGKINYLYPKPQDLTMDILNRTFGNMPNVAVFQRFCDKESFAKFTMALEVKEANIKKVQNVRMFLQVVVSNSLVANVDNFYYLDKMIDVSKRIEGVLINPHNNKMLQDLTKTDVSKIYGFRKEHVKEIKKIYGKIASVNDFCLFLTKLNKGKILPYYESKKAATSPDAEPAKSWFDKLFPCWNGEKDKPETPVDTPDEAEEPAQAEEPGTSGISSRMYSINI